MPQPGDYYAPPQESQGRALIRGPEGDVRLIFNVCSHRQAIMLNGILFEDNGYDVAAEFATLGPRAHLDFSGFTFDRADLHECNHNWKTFIEVYLEDYHVGPFHPGLGSFVTCDDLRWEFGRNHSVQTVGVADDLAQAGSPAYATWHQALLAYRGGHPPKRGDNEVGPYQNPMEDGMQHFHEWYAARTSP